MAAEPPDSQTVSLLIVDDEPLIRSELIGALTQFPYLHILGEAENGDEGVQKTRELRPDVVLMDVRMPVCDGLSATQVLVEDSDFTGAVLVLTTFDSDDYVYRAMHLGARGFLLKRWPIAKIARAIELAATGESVIFPDSLARVIAEHGPGTQVFSGDANQRSRALRPGSNWVEELLTPREQVVLTQMAHGLNNAEVAEALCVTVETVKSQVSSILTKFGVRDRTQAVIRAFESGFIDPHGSPTQSVAPIG